MKYLGIDYGEKRIGLALSDSEGKMAFPKETIPNNGRLFLFIKKYMEENKAEAVVVGASYGQNKEANPIMKEILELKKALENEGVKVFLEREDFSSMHAGFLAENRENLDGSAAAIILERFLARLGGGTPAH